MVSSSDERSTLPSPSHWSRAICGKNTRFLPMDRPSVPCPKPGLLIWPRGATVSPVTPALSAVYDELLVRAAAPPWRDRAEAWKEEFLRRTSSTGDPGASEERLRAAWDDVLTRGGLAGEIADALD